MSNLQLKTSYKDIIRFAIPISVSMIIPQINFVINNVFLSRLGEQALGTAGITGVYYLIFAVIGFGFNSGLQSLLSREAGQNDRLEIGRLFAQAMKIVVFMALVGLVFTQFLASPILKNQIRDPEILNMAISFIKIRILGLPFLYFYQLGNSFLISTNNTRFLIYAAVAEALTNVVLDYLLIFGHYGMPRLGFEGAAWASVIAELVGMIVVHGFLWYKRLPQEFKVMNFKKWDGAASFKLLDRSAPLIFQLLASLISWLLFYLWIEHLGERSLAISNTMRNVFGIFGIIIWAMAATSNNMVSNVIGQGKLNEVLPTIKKIGSVSFIMIVPLCILINIFPHLFYSIFNASPDFVDDAIPVMRTVSLAIILMSQGSVWLNAISGTGLTKITLSIEILTVMVYVIYVYFAVQIKSNTLVWAWASEFFYWGIILICALIFFHRYNWKLKVEAQT